MYQIIILPIITMVVTQTLKFLIKSNHLKFNIKNLFAYSGMPSGHASVVISLATIVGLKEGLHSPLFAICAIIALLTIRDALGVRRYLGQHGKILNILVKDLKDDDVLEENYPHLIERIGHTPSQILVGSLIGFLVSSIGFLLLN